MGKILPATEREERQREGNGRIASYSCLCFLMREDQFDQILHQLVKFIFYDWIVSLSAEIVE
jgi:hypothetical protein